MLGVKGVKGVKDNSLVDNELTPTNYIQRTKVLSFHSPSEQSELTHLTPLTPQQVELAKLE